MCAQCDLVLKNVQLISILIIYVFREIVQLIFYEKYVYAEGTGTFKNFIETNDQ